jgi:hypothetical protein
MAHEAEPTARLEVLDGAAGAAIAGAVVAWAALAAGMGPLAADRAGRALESAVAGSAGPVTLTASIGAGGAVVELMGIGQPASLVEGMGAVESEDGRIQLLLRTPQLRGM